MTSAHDIAVVFVNYHSERLIRPRASRFSEAGFEVLVADNSGTYGGDGRTRVIAMVGNEGFGAGCNRAAAAASSAASTLCFHNPDVDIACESVLELAGRLGASLGGAVAPAELNFGHLRTAGYRYPSGGREALLCTRAVLAARGLLGRSHSIPRSGRERRAPAVGARWGGTRGSRFPGGGLLVVDRAAHEAIGGFDERYFLYAEDLDYWHRLRFGGHPCSIDPSVVAVHDVSTGSPLAAGRREILRWLGVELFLEKFDRRGLRLARPVHRASLRLLAGAWPEVARPLAAAWRDRRTPGDCLARLRPVLSGS